MAIVNSDCGDQIFEIEYTSNTSSNLPITISSIDGVKNYYNLEELDNIIRVMVEFRVSYNEKECRDITTEEERRNFDQNYEEYQAYEAERIAREEERLRNEYI